MSKKCFFFSESGFRICYYCVCRRCSESYFSFHSTSKICIDCNKSLYFGTLLNGYPFYSTQDKNDKAKAIIMINKIESAEYGERRFFDKKEKFLEFIKKINGED